MKVIANMFSIGLSILIIFLYSNNFEFIFKTGILVFNPIFNMAIPKKKKEQEVICQKKKKFRYLIIYLIDLSKLFVV